MKPLPGGLAEALHIDEPFPWGAVVFALLSLASLLLWLWRRRRRPRKVRPAPPRPSVVAPQPGDLATFLRDLLGRVGRDLDPRAACHELASFLRRHVERRTGRPFPTLTAGEIRRLSGDTPLARLFTRLAAVQFGRRSPRRREVRALCEAAREVASDPETWR